LTEGSWDSDELRRRISSELDGFLQARQADLSFMQTEGRALLEALRDFTLGGGKRLRPIFVYWGFRAGGGEEDCPEIVRASLATELLHAFALIHDDIMDASDTRRGRPTAHRAFEAMAQEAGFRGDASAFGLGAGILLGDLAFAWADAALVESGFSPERLAGAFRVFNTMRTELMGGQYLDLLVAARGRAGVEDVRRVAAYKSAKYTVERPLHLGLALAGGDPALAERLTAYGLPLGEGFQLRDDVLGVFGQPTLTGKPSGDDLREGKQTALVALARGRATGEVARLLDERVGARDLTENEVEALRQAIVDTGALEATEQRITSLAAESRTSLASLGLPAPVHAALDALVTDLCFRQS